MLNLPVVCLACLTDQLLLMDEDGVVHAMVDAFIQRGTRAAMKVIRVMTDIEDYIFERNTKKVLHVSSKTVTPISSIMSTQKYKNLVR